MGIDLTDVNGEEAGLEDPLTVLLSRFGQAGGRQHRENWEHRQAFRKGRHHGGSEDDTASSVPREGMYEGFQGDL